MSPSQIRTRGSWKFKRTSETDRWLDAMGFYRKHTARDPSCLFRAVSENVFNTQKYFQKVRSQCVDYMAKTRNIFEAMIHGSIDNYLQKIASPNEWGGMIEINALSRLYRHDFVIFDNTRKEPQTKISNGYGDTIYLFYIQDINHFDTVYKKEYIKVASFSQSIIYEALYAGVFQLTDLPYAVDKMLHDKIPTNQLEYLLDETVENKNIIKNDVSDMFNNDANDQNLSVFDLSGQKYVPNIVEEQILDQNNNTDMKLVCKNQPKKKDKKEDGIKLVDLLLFNNQCGGVDEDDSYLYIDVNSARNLLDYGITPFPYKVAKALDPDIYRNIEYDVWNEMRRELKYGVRYGDGSVLQVGVKCLCKIETHQEESYHCHIQEMTADRGPCLVFIEELGEKRLVNYDQLEPIPIEQAKAWIFPHRNLQNNPNYHTVIQQMGNVSRKSSPLKTNSKVKGDVHDDADLERSNQKKQSQVKQYKPKSNWKALPLAVDVREDGNQNNILWGIDDSVDHKQCSSMPSNINLALYNHMDYMMFEPYPIEYLAMPIITECHSAGEGAQGNGISPQPTHKPAQQNGPSGDGNSVLNQMTPTSNEAGVSVSGDCGSTMFTSGGGSLSPHNTNTLSTFSNYNGSQFNVPPPPYVVYGGMMNSGNAPPGSGSFGAPPPVSGKPMAGGMPPQPLMSPPLPPLPPPTYGVNVSAAKSSHPNGQDLPLNDLQTVRFFFNLGVDYLWYWANIQPVGMPSMGLMPAHPPHLHNVYLPMPHQSHQPQHRVNDLDDLSQDFQTLNFMDRGSNPNQGKAGNKNKQDNMNNKGGKGMGQNPGQGVRGAPLGPRFKRGDTMLSGNKGNGGNNKGNNNMRRSSYGMPPNIQSPVGNENCISCCDEQVMIGGGPPLPQQTQYYTFGLPEDLVMQAPMVDPSAAYLMPGLPTHYVGYGYCPPGYYAAGPPMGPPPPMGAYCPSGPPMGPPLYCAPPNEMPK